MLIKFSSAYFLFPRKLSIYFPLYFRAYGLIEPTNPAISALCYAPERDNLGETAWSLVFLVSVVGREKTDPMFLTFAPNLFNRSCRSRGPSFACVQSLERCRNILREITYGVMLRSKGEGRKRFPSRFLLFSFWNGDTAGMKNLMIHCVILFSFLSITKYILSILI